MVYLEFARRNRRISQKQLAALTHIRQSDLSQMERRSLRPTPVQAERLSRVLDVSVELLTREVRIARPDADASDGERVAVGA